MADPELDAMQTVANALKDLEPDQQQRIVRWSAERFGVALTRGLSNSGRFESEGSAPLSTEGGSRFTDFVDLLDAVVPKTAVISALTGAYWLQVIQGEQSWASKAVNDLLKDTGNGIANITSSLSQAETRKPALVRQVSKSGRSAQSRKQYKLTTTGIALIRDSIGGGNGASQDEE